MVSFEAVIFYVLLVDSIIANILSWCCVKWYKKNYKGFYKHFPVTKGWCIWYLILVLWIGYALYRLGILPY